MGHSNSLNLQTSTSVVLISGFFIFFPRRLEYIYLFSTGRYGGGAVFLKDLKILSETRVFRFDPKFNAVLKWHNNVVLANTGLNFHT